MVRESDQLTRNNVSFIVAHNVDWPITLALIQYGLFDANLTTFIESVSQYGLYDANYRSEKEEEMALPNYRSASITQTLWVIENSLEFVRARPEHVHITFSLVISTLCIHITQSKVRSRNCCRSKSTVCISNNRIPIHFNTNPWYTNWNPV